MEQEDVLLVQVGGAAAWPEWQAAFQAAAPGLRVRAFDDPAVDPATVTHALVWQPEPGWLARFPHLRLILSAAAGVDHILADPQLPALPIVRMVTPETAERMGDFVLFAALGMVRELPALIDSQRERRWSPRLTGRLASQTTVGVMGLGQLGAHVAGRLRAAGFRVMGWSRSAKQLPGIECLGGQADWPDFLSRSEILVNLLPGTPETAAILDAAAFARLPAGACLINVGRGSHVDEQALLDALDQGRLGAALLDVFDLEPLPAGHALWSHPRVIVTPHIASTASRAARARQAAHTIAADRNGGAIDHLYLHARGY